MKTACLVLFISLFNSVVAAEVEQKKPIPEDLAYITAVIPVFSQKVSISLPTNWKAVYEDQQQGSYIIEFIPKEENIDNWKNLFTVQGFENIADKTTPIDFLNSIAFRLKQVCGDYASFEKLGPMNITGHNAFAVVMGCSRMPVTNETSGENYQSELGYYLSIQGKQDYYLVHKLVRGDVFDPKDAPINKDNAAAFLSEFMPIELCQGGGEDYECKR